MDVRELTSAHLDDGWDTTVGVGKVFWGVTESRQFWLAQLSMSKLRKRFYRLRQNAACQTTGKPRLKRAGQSMCRITGSSSEQKMMIF